MPHHDRADARSDSGRAIQGVGTTRTSALRRSGVGAGQWARALDLSLKRFAVKLGYAAKLKTEIVACRCRRCRCSRDRRRQHCVGATSGKGPPRNCAVRSLNECRGSIGQKTESLAQFVELRPLLAWKASRRPRLDEHLLHAPSQPRGQRTRRAEPPGASLLGRRLDPCRPPWPVDRLHLPAPTPQREHGWTVVGRREIGSTNPSSAAPCRTTKIGGVVKLDTSSRKFRPANSFSPCGPNQSSPVSSNKMCFATISLTNRFDLLRRQLGEDLFERFQNVAAGELTPLQQDRHRLLGNQMPGLCRCLDRLGVALGE